MRKVHPISAAERRKIHLTLERYFEMDLHDRTALIAEIEGQGCLRVFGYGSLMRDPHMNPDAQYWGFIPGYVRGPFLSDRYLRGRPDELGVTMGILPHADPRVKLRGLVQSIRGSGGLNGKNGLLKSIMAFAQRETSLNPIYAYKLMDVQTRFGKVKAVVCGTNIGNPQFVGDILTLKEAAAIIASSYGEEGASKRNTGLAYWRFILGSAYKSGEEPEAHIKLLVSTGNAYRGKLPAELRSKLEKLEDIPERKTFDPRVFEVNAAADRASPQEVMETLRAARLKLDSGDPLPPQRRRLVERNMRKLRDAPRVR